MSVQDFVGRVTLTDAQREVLPTLEPSFEHLLHDAKVDPATILALRHCQITDRETFAALDDTVDGLKTVALDMGLTSREEACPTSVNSHGSRQPGRRLGLKRTSR